MSFLTLRLPGGSTVAVPLLSRNADFGISRDFPTKLALDAAFPNGTYRLSGDGIPAMAFNLATDAYPSTVPTVANTGYRVCLSDTPQLDAFGAAQFLSCSAFAHSARGKTHGLRPERAAARMPPAELIHRAALL
jgi:hypothetical protein